MVKFSRLIAERWNVPQELSELICTSFEKGESPYFLCDYRPDLIAEVDAIQVWEMYDFLQNIADLGPKKKRALTALTKAGALDDELKRRIELTVDVNELDDIVISYRPNSRSRAQLALAKGLAPLADLVIAQEEESADLKQLAQEYVGKDTSLKSAEDVLAGVKDILAERFAYDETVRAMAREFCHDDGFFQIVPKSRKDPRYAKVRDKMIPVSEVTWDDFLAYCAAEEKKDIRFKLGVQLFRITEVLRHHFVENPDAIGFDLICSAIDDSWQRLLFPIIERDVKKKIRDEAESWALKQISQDLQKKFDGTNVAGRSIVTAVLDDEGKIACVAVAGDGRLLAASGEKKALGSVPLVSERLRKLIARYNPLSVAVGAGEHLDVLRLSVEKTIEAEHSSAELAILGNLSSRSKAAQSVWMKSNFADLEPAMQVAYALGISVQQPMRLIAEIGAEHFTLHPLQDGVAGGKLNELINRKIAQDELHKGILIRDIADSVLKSVPAIPVDVLAEIRSKGIRKPFATKRDILSVKGVSAILFRNIAGYIVLPDAADPLDATQVHPDHYDLVLEMCQEINAPVQAVINDPALLISVRTESFQEQLFIQKNLSRQLQVGAKYLANALGQNKRKLRLDEVVEGTVLQGRVTNITQFGVFVNINAVCDGLIHISQLADSYVESPDQVVSVGDTVYVRVVKVDPKKRRISLSMKDLGTKAPKVKPTTNQLDTLVNHFSRS